MRARRHYVGARLIRQRMERREVSDWKDTTRYSNVEKG